MSGFDPLLVMLDELAPVVEPEQPAWDDVLRRAGLVTIEPVIGRRRTSRGGRRLSAALTAGLVAAVVASALAIAGVSPLTTLQNVWNSSARPGPLAGSYSTTLSGLEPASLDGRWTLTFTPYSNAVHMASAGGSYSLSRNGTLMETGSFGFGGGNTFSNFHVTDTGGPAECPTTRVPGLYELRYDSTTLKLQTSFDQCKRRRVVLSSRPFTR